jgi:ParB family chromosome partitioning protein
MEIVANRGLWEPILVEPIEGADGEFLIIDGHRRYRNCKALVEATGQKEYDVVPVEVIERPLTPAERMMVWIYIHRQRKEWDTMVKEGVAYQLVSYVGKAPAAEMLGLKLTELDRLCEIYEFGRSRFSGLQNPEAALTWAREILGLPRRLVSPDIQEIVVKKVNQRSITNSKDIRELRKILRNADAKDEFLRDGGTIDSALAKLPLQEGRSGFGRGLEQDLDMLAATVESVLTRYPWTVIQDLRGNKAVEAKIRACEEVLKKLRAAVIK